MKKFLSKIWSGWKRFAHILGRVNTEIILFLFYYLVFTPFGAALKLFGYDPLGSKVKGDSGWREVKIGEFDPEKASHQS
ncbi:MAG: hypothetical protein DRP46_13855 [Candidatus Zixiibacteriota bacterium]|nr:MAG: hypothetical protein DRP46_13855 [candidate division Zixibacteria bacterium]HDL02497.1 hypothetical protein [candidate division Zixibacteria bacterium]